MKTELSFTSGASAPAKIPVYKLMNSKWKKSRLSLQFLSGMRKNARTPVRRLIEAMILFFLALLAGFSGFQIVEGYSPLDALYMTIITMSTVGYETIGTLSQGGKVFVMFLIIFTLGTFFYAVTTFTTFIVEGEIRHVFRQYKVGKEVSKLKDHIIICGLGRNGREAANELMDQNISFIAIESKQEKIDDFLDHNPGELFIVGDATQEEVLLNANVKTCRGIITSLPDDAANVFVTLTARELNKTAYIVSRAANESTISKMHTAGANKVVLPNLIGGRKMARIITKPALAEFVDLITGEGETKLHLEEVACFDKRLVGKTIGTLEIRRATGVLVLGYKGKDGSYHFNPNADKVVELNEILFVLGRDDQLKNFKREFEQGVIAPS